MARNRRLPAAYDEADAGPLAHNDNDGSERIVLERVQPSPTGVFIQRWWRRSVLLLQTGLVVGILSAYPVMTVMSHKIDDSPIVLSDAQPWAFPEAGIAITKIARELESSGWASDRAAWHPQARLTALPAWQDATAAALAELTGTLAKSIPGAAGEDTDLGAAARLLTAEAGQPMRPRLTAAAEALGRFDTRVAYGKVVMPSRTDTLKAEAAVFARWASADNSAISKRIQAGTAGTVLPATKSDIEVYYEAKARAHVAAEMLAALKSREASLNRFPAVNAAVSRAGTAWRRASQQSPVFVTNLSGEGLTHPNNMSGMAYFIGEADLASAQLVTALAALPAGGLESVASAEPPAASAAP